MTDDDTPSSSEGTASIAIQSPTCPMRGDRSFESHSNDPTPAALAASRSVCLSPIIKQREAGTSKSSNALSSIPGLGFRQKQSMTYSSLMASL